MNFVDSLPALTAIYHLAPSIIRAVCNNRTGWCAHTLSHSTVTETVTMVIYLVTSPQVLRIQFV